MSISAACRGARFLRGILGLEGDEGVLEAVAGLEVADDLAALDVAEPREEQREVLVRSEPLSLDTNSRHIFQTRAYIIIYLLVKPPAQTD